MSRLILIGNGFDLAHGLKTSYTDFLNWYSCSAFESFKKTNVYQDLLMEIKSKFTGMRSEFTDIPSTHNEVIEILKSNEYQSIKYHSNFFERLIISHEANEWVDIERRYFSLLKAFFSNNSFHGQEKVDTIKKLNGEFGFLKQKLAEYITEVNIRLTKNQALPINNSRLNIKTVIHKNDNNPAKFITFNYTDTLSKLYSVDQDEIIHIHGQVSDIERNPIIFGYGDETDSVYQQLEDSGENIYLEHIKSFAYFQTTHYKKLLSLVDSAPYEVSIAGHSCGLSDRVLLQEIFQHPNCKSIDVFYHVRKDGTDNFKEITQEISRHFRPENKQMMRRKVLPKNSANTIPQASHNTTYKKKILREC